VIACAHSVQAITQLAIDLAGRNRLPMIDRSGADWASAAPAATPFGPVAVQSYLFERAQTIYGGSTEVQKNIIWRSLAGMAR
jgi:alkylation response protein AidB-like acyl-CoA dehydrogenase